VRRRLATAIVLSILAVLAAAGPAHAWVDTYVAIGDSYSSGVGTRSYYNDSCKKSYYAYPHLLQDNWPRKPPVSRGAVLFNYTCGGATIGQALSSQVPYIPAYATHVTVTLGGNDAGFGDVIKQCAKPWPTTCWGDIDKAKAYIRDTLPYKLGTLYARMREEAPFAHIFVLGYPRLFGPQECGGAARISEGEQRELNETADLLRNAMGWMTAISGRAFYFVDAIPNFRGHAICSGSNEWLNGLSNPTSESFHPNRTGQRAYFQLVTWAMVTRAG
jgi:lysophospholipase L1-like esterase